MKKILYTINQPPYANAHTLEQLEAAMVGAVFDCDVSLLFRDEGVWSLLKNQDGRPLEQRTISKVLTALPSYDIEKLYVCSHSLASHHLVLSDLALDVEVLDYPGQTALINSQDAVIGAPT